MTSSTPFDDLWTTFGSRFDTDINLQANHRCDCAVRRCALQPIAGCQPFSCRFKEAFLTPIDITVCSYRPILNLSVLLKLLERLVARQLRDYLTSADLLLPLQSGFRTGHSTETPVLQVLSDILQALYRLFISHTIRYHSPSYHSRQFFCYLTCKCL